MEEPSTTTLVRLARVRAHTRSGRARQIRLDSHVTQAEMAATVGVSESTIGRWEDATRVPHGDPALRYLDTLEALEVELGSELAAAG